MQTEPSVFSATLTLLTSTDARLWEVLRLSFMVSGLASMLALAFGLPLGAWVALRGTAARQPLRWLVGLVALSLNAAMALPSVVVGLACYLLLSRAGPLGSFGMLFTPTAIVLVQTLLTLPLVAALTRQTIEDAWAQYADSLTALGASRLRAALTLLWDCRFSLLTVALAGFARAISEVGAVMIVGGNIDGVTRVMTTTIALETSKGDVPLALALGAVLLATVWLLNLAAFAARAWALKRYG
jgi:tungstate transport system permease protein